MHFSQLAAAGALAATAAALPKNAMEIREAEKHHGATDTYGDWTGHNASYPDGSGIYVRTDDEHHYFPSFEKCWTDLYFVSAHYEAENWVRQPTSIDCASTSNCASGEMNTTQHCTSWSIGTTATLDYKIIPEVLGISLGVTATETTQNCFSSMSSNTCTWDDDKCHALWTSNVNLINQCYIRRRCNKGGDHTVWSMDLNITVPSEYTRLGCGAFCEDMNYPYAVPLPPTGPSHAKMLTL